MKPDLSKPLDDLQYSVDPAHHGTRLDRFLASKLTWRSRTSIKTLLDDGSVLVNGSKERLKRSRRLLDGDRVSVLIPKPAENEIRHDSIPLEVIHEDPYFLALNKQPGILCHPVSRNLYNTLINALHYRYRNLENPGEDVVPSLAHRLDRNTSGVLLVAKSAKMRAVLQKLIERGDVVKTYRTVVAGIVSEDEGRIESPIGKDPTGRSKVMMAVRDDGLPSLTTFRVLRRFARHTEVLVRIHTGRTHQIRVHMSSIGHPVCGDTLYRADPDSTESEGSEPRAPRQCLHAESVRFQHPIRGSNLLIEAPLPADLKEFLAQLARLGRFEPDTSSRRNSEMRNSQP